MEIVEARRINQEAWRTIIKTMPATQLHCNHCGKAIGIGDFIGHTLSGRLEGFNCKACFEVLKKAQRMN